MPFQNKHKDNLSLQLLLKKMLPTTEHIAHATVITAIHLSQFASFLHLNDHRSGQNGAWGLMSFTRKWMWRKIGGRLHPPEQNSTFSTLRDRKMFSLSQFCIAFVICQSRYREKSHCLMRCDGMWSTVCQQVLSAWLLLKRYSYSVDYYVEKHL